MSEKRVPEAGQAAPDFTASSTAGQISLDDYRGQKLVLYFYPKADTPGCTREACAFRDASAAYREKGVAVVGVSADDLDAQSQFDQKYSLNMPLIADPDREVIDAYGVWGERTRPDGTKTIGVRRMTFLIGPDGTIAKVYPNVTPDGHADEILRDVAALG